MVGIVEALILGALQGVTEWLPVSSSGHLALAQHFLGLEKVPLFFDISLHAGTLLAVFAYFRKELAEIIRDVASGNWESGNSKLAAFSLLALFPTAIIGFGLKKFFASMFQSIELVGVALLITGTLLFVSRNAKEKGKLGWDSALLMGIAQGFAVAPGISRSGATISAGILFGVERKKAAFFSFLMAIPAVIGATAYESLGGIPEAIGIEVMLAGIAASLAVGYVSIGVLFRALNAKWFYKFAYYCWALGLAAIAISVAI